MPSLKAAEYIRLILHEYGPAQGRDVLCEMACGYLAYLALNEGRESIDRLLRERINALAVRRSEKKIELVYSQGNAIGGAQ